MGAKGKTGKTIRQKAIIPAGPAEVYEAILNPRIHAEFTGGKATGSARKGGTFTAWDGYITGKNLELVKGIRIVQEWSTSEWPGGYPPSKLDLRFKAHPRGTELTMVHSRVPASQAASYARGWKEHYWSHLTEYFRSRKKE